MTESLGAVIILGLIQGITEFLPVSSSGHLVLSQHLLGITFPGITFEIVVHIGTLLAVVLVFRRDIIIVTRVFLQGLGLLVTGKRPDFTGEKRVAWRFAWLIVFGSIPTALLGVLGEEVFEALFSSVTMVGAMLLVTGTLLWMIERVRGGRGKNIGEVGIIDALFIGFAQGCAIVPGISRSGATISGALYRGLNRDAAMRFSFLLSLPAIAGAAIFKLPEVATAVRGPELGFTAYGLGLIVSALSGIGSIKVLYGVLQKGRLHLFGYYCWGVGLLVLVLRFFSRL